MQKLIKDLPGLLQTIYHTDSNILETIYVSRLPNSVPYKTNYLKRYTPNLLNCLFQNVFSSLVNSAPLPVCMHLSHLLDI